MADYKSTLNLPKTLFPMKADLAKREPECLAFWQSSHLYSQIRASRLGKPRFIVHDGPPYANGSIHLGHALNKTLKDIIVKAKTLQGYDSPYVPGWDCHGLPIELNVEKKRGKAGVAISEEEFIKASRVYAASQITLQSEAFQRLGVLGDWQYPYKTLDRSYEADAIRSLARIVAQGHLQQGSKPVHWCVVCGSALAEAEVEYQDKESPAIDVRFVVYDLALFTQRLGVTDPLAEPVSIPIWTTTPWTLPANQAVALHPSIDYALVKCVLAEQAQYLVVAQSLLPAVMARYGVTQYHVVTVCRGETLAGIALKHPFLQRQVPVLMAEYVTMEAGTGAVHTAPAHGQEDYVLCAEHNIEISNPVDSQGCFHADTEFFAGTHVFKANELIIAVLQRSGNLVHATKLVHSYPHCWRHKKPLIFRATPQWFISMEKNGLRQAALQAVATSEFIPDWGRARITDMVAKRPDWCISRQRIWGTPLPLIIHKETRALHPDTIMLLQAIADKVEQQGIEAWRTLDLVDLLGDSAIHYEKVKDTLDVWFDSGVSHATVLAKRIELQVPADLYLEGSDQHRGWFQTSLLTAVAMRGSAPFKAVLTHGYTVDAHGHKMSKSLGNTLAPEKIWNQLGADVLRLWVASTDYRNDISISEEILTRITDTYRRIRNTARYLLSNLHDYQLTDEVSYENLLSLDRWIVDAAACLQQEIIEAYESYQFHAVYHKIRNFCSVELGGFYLDIIKDRQYTMPAQSVARRSAQTAMYHIVQALVRWLAPILSFTAEEIWQHMPWQIEGSVFLSEFYSGLRALEEDGELGRVYWQHLLLLRNEVNKALEQARNQPMTNQKAIGGGLEAKVVIYANEDWQRRLARLGDELRFVFITSAASSLPLSEKPPNALATAIDGVFISVQALAHSKCVRCWHRCPDIGGCAEHPELCARCVENVVGSGEERRYA